MMIKIVGKKLKRLPHKYSHNRLYFELKSRMWNAFREHCKDADQCYMIVDAIDTKPDVVKKAIRDIFPEHNQRDLLSYVDRIVELGGIVE